MFILFMVVETSDCKFILLQLMSIRLFQFYFWFYFGFTYAQKCPEMPGNAQKCPEMPGTARKSEE